MGKDAQNKESKEMFKPIMFEFYELFPCLSFL
jgi:hypothetical protein